MAGAGAVGEDVELEVGAGGHEGPWGRKRLAGGKCRRPVSFGEKEATPASCAGCAPATASPRIACSCPMRGRATTSMPINPPSDTWIVLKFGGTSVSRRPRSEETTSELQSLM